MGYTIWHLQITRGDKMRPLIPEVFNSVSPIQNQNLDMAWKRPIVFIEAPGTSAYDLHLHWHRRCMRDPNYIGFMDLLLNARGVRDKMWGPIDISPITGVECQMPFMQGPSLGAKPFKGDALEVMLERIEFAKSFFAQHRSAAIRYYTEPVPEGFEQANKTVEELLFPHARLVFVEKKIDPVFNLIRMAIQNEKRENNQVTEYEISDDMLIWYIASLKKYYNLKNIHRKQAGVVAIEDYSKGDTFIEWQDNVKVTLAIKRDPSSRPFGFRLPGYISPANFKDIDSRFKAAWK